MTRTIYLHGKMGELFGEVWNLNAATVAECMNGIDCQREGKLKQYLLDCTEKGIMFTVQKGKEFLDYDNLQMNLGENDLIITPVPAGSANKLLKVIVGFVLMVGAAYLMMTGTFAGIAGFLKFAGLVGMGMAGSMLLNSGMAEYMAPKKPGDQNDAFLFDGPVNTVKEGLPVPLAYGQVLVGGATISFGFTDREVSSASGFTFSSSTGGTSINYGDSAPNSGEPGGNDVSGPPNTDVQKNVSIDWNLGHGGK